MSQASPSDGLLGDCPPGTEVFRTRFLGLLENRAALPSFSASTTRLFHATNNLHTTADEIESIITLDPALALRCIRAAATARFGVGSVNSVKEAVLLAGMRRIQQVAISAILVEKLRQLSGRVDWRQFWRHSLLVARIADRLGSAFGVQAGHAHMAGLFHDIGKVFLQQYFPEEFDRVVAISQDGEGLACHLAEAYVLGMDHAQVGAAVAHRLGVPEPVVFAVRYHHEPLAESCLAEPATGGGLLPSCISVANAAAKQLVAGIQAEAPAAALDELPEFQHLCQFERVQPLRLDVADELQLVDDELEVFLQH